MALPSSGQISLEQIGNEYGGSYSINQYYRGGSYVSSEFGDPKIPTGGQVSWSDYYATRKWNFAYATIGNRTSAINDGCALIGGGDATGFMNLCAGYNVYGSWGRQHSVNGFWTGVDGTGVRISAGNLSGNWIPLIPTIYGVADAGNVYGSRIYTSQFAIGMGWFSGRTDYLDSNTIFVWKHPLSNWTDYMIQGQLGFSSYQSSKVATATRVWWEDWAGGMNQEAHLGFMILKASTHNSSGAQTCYNNSTKKRFVHFTDNGGEWGVGHVSWSPTINGTNVTNVGYTQTGVDGYGNPVYGVPNLSFDGRASGSITEVSSDYTVIIGKDDLVVPMMLSYSGVGGAYSGGNYRWISSQFGYIRAY